ncbi:MAG TPA: GNAT family N-acetyltransferase [Streptosporangiaceae bacterium]|nr:GNAT family N-acetyltransferase [Streptosporangiaceae bacterium]
MESARDIDTGEILACDESFFAAMLAADHDLLGTILADDFVIIDVLSGQVALRDELLGAISSGQLRFAEVTRYAGERSVRLRASAAVVTGRTRMVIRYQGNEVTAHSRYAHVYTRDGGRWRLMSAQGTPTRAPRMSPGRAPLFCDTALAGRIERVESQLIAQCNQAARRRAGMAGFVIPVAGGVASFAGEGSPYNKVAGLGFGGVPDPAALDEIEKAFAAAGSPVQIELAHLADPAISALLAGRGYRLESFENVLGRALTGGSGRVMPPGIEVRPSGEEEFETWLDVVAEGSVHPDTQGLPWHEEFSREAIIEAERDSAAAGDVRYAALRDGVIVGGATMRIAEGVAQLTGAATAPAHRRRGVQTALLSARLADAAATGCDVAVITTQPGSKSQQNAQRQGFDLLYTRAVLVKHPDAAPP